MLKVDAAKMHKVDTKNVENLYGMWSGKGFPFAAFSSQSLTLSTIVFSKCADLMEDGRRLENLSWRLWCRETFCCEAQPQSTTPEINLSSSRPRTADIPELSASVESASSDESDQLDSRHSLRTAPVNFRPSPLRCTEPAKGVSRGREKHISSLRLEKMVLSIKEQQKVEPLSPSIAVAVPTHMPSRDITPRPASPTMHAPLRSSESSSSTAPLSSPSSEHSSRQTVGSDTSAELITSHSVVRGFSPNQVSSSYRSHTHLAPAPIPTKSIPHSKAEGSKAGGMFLLGGSSGDDDSSFDEQMSCQPTRQSSLTAGLKLPLRNKKQTSFKDEVESRTINHKSHEDEGVFESDDEGDTPESAIEEDDEEEDDDDDDGSDWEDSVSDSAEPLTNDKQLFQRVDSRPNITSRRSLLTTLIHQPDRAAAFANMASKSASVLQHPRTSPPNSNSAGTSPEDEDSGLAMLPSNMTRSKPIIMTTSNTHPPALSPRTTRRNMLATELTQSLRKHLLWERQQKSTTANAVLKRRHTAHDVTNLQEYPGRQPGQSTKDGSKNNSWNHYFDHGLGEYHQTGW